MSFCLYNQPINYKEDVMTIFVLNNSHIAQSATFNKFLGWEGWQLFIRWDISQRAFTDLSYF